MRPALSRLRTRAVAVALVALAAGGAVAESIGFRQAVAEAAAGDAEIAAFYRGRDYAALWTDPSPAAAERRRAALGAFAGAAAHGLPVGAYGGTDLEAALGDVRGDAERGEVEVAMTRAFLAYARDVQTGVLTPGDVDEGIVRRAPLRDRSDTMADFAGSSPAAFIGRLAPQTPEYARLLAEKLRLERLLEGRGGWGGAVPAGPTLEPGDTGPRVIALRNRLIAMDYLGRTTRPDYDDSLSAAVRAFQADHGLAVDGKVGPATLEALNVDVATRLTQVIVAMERERWLNFDRGARHVWVNLADFTAAIIDDGKVTFRTRSVVGMDATDRRSPEFSDVMDHMVINPTWYVPRSIVVDEYLPLLWRNPMAVPHLELVGPSGRVYGRNFDFRQWTKETFPFSMREPPNQGNALGLLKFMLQNPYNIYLHDTPQKQLFDRAKRDFSHGCIRLRDPFDFAYTLLARQTRDPVGFFQARLATGEETRVDLETPIQVHLVYRTAFTEAKGRTQFRGDVYGRDLAVWRALERAGVTLGRPAG